MVPSGCFWILTAMLVVTSLSLGPVSQHIDAPIHPRFVANNWLYSKLRQPIDQKHCINEGKQWNKKWHVWNCKWLWSKITSRFASLLICRKLKTYTCTHTHECACTHIHMHIYMCICTSMHAHTHVHMHLHTHTHTHTHTHIHTHAHTFRCFYSDEEQCRPIHCGCVGVWGGSLIAKTLMVVKAL